MITAARSDEARALTACAHGSMLADAGDLAGAIQHYVDAVQAAPSLLPLHLILANAQQLAGDVLAARQTLRRAVRVAARSDTASEFTLGKALVDAGAGADAVPCFRRVRVERPHDAAAAAALAAALREAQQLDDAWREIQHALRTAPEDPVAMHMAALIRHDAADFAQALTWCERSLAIRPDAPGTQLTRAYLKHLLGDDAGGWADFEARALPRPVAPALPWRGESLESRTLLLLGEHGVGDQFQFLRFVHHPEIQTAARVVISCQADAVALLRASGYDAVARECAVDADYFVPLLSLPLRLGVGASWPGAGETYLRVSDTPPAPAVPPRRVGVVWAGNPAHRNDAVRSMPSAVLGALTHAHPDTQFISLQHGARDADLPSRDWVRAPGGDWLATARQVCSLDLVLTVDTGIAHLAGALGVPVWILLPHVPDWRWGAEGSATPWYPRARLFRQTERGNWGRVITNVSAALSASRGQST
jgi:Flp pilus assembly protein TadD